MRRVERCAYIRQVLAFPCNQFGDGNTYEPDSNAVVQTFVDGEITKFTQEGDTPLKFPLFAKSTVNGPMCSEPAGVGCRPDSVECCTANNDVYDYLRAATFTQGDPLDDGQIGWNFDKFLVGKDGNVVAHYAAGSIADGCGPSWAGCTEGLRRDIEAALEARGSPPLHVPGRPIHSMRAIKAPL
eukprot:SAG31_NODE_2108_length_6427_cov_7.816688_3_plen_184_part_00